MFVLSHYKKISHYCEIIINRGVLIFADFVVHLNNEIQFSHWLLPVLFEITNSRTHEPIHFAETTKIGANE
jgi:acetyltransferase-like isoleucine patch superfamily enzyme